MKTKAYLSAILLVIGCADKKDLEVVENGHPKLIVTITVDQMRNDFLDIYGEEFDGGFRTLLDNGRRFKSAWADHAPTNSYPGHASIATGAYPANHGFSDNSWKIREAGQWQRVYADDQLPHDCDADGSNPKGDGLSAKTLGERIIEHGGKFAAISASRNIARIYAGNARAPVFWLSPGDGGYITSTCYQDELPDWVAHFNNTELPSFVTGRWDLTLPDEVVASLRPDASDFEGEGGPVAFPHIAPEGEENNLEWFYDTPAADASALALAIKAINAEGLGRDDIPDLLNIVINTIDNTGHRYGPFSVEQTDNLFQLDQNLGLFIEKLDEIVGAGEWTLVLTADHGAAPAPESVTEAATARRLTEEEVAAVIAAAHDAAGEFSDDDPARTQAAANAVRSFDFVDRVYVGDEIVAAAQSGDTVAQIYANSFRSDRPARHPFYDTEDKGLAEFGLTVVLDEYTMPDWATSIHGSHYDYDRAVPLIFLGAGVENGVSTRSARTISIAPTLLDIAGLPTDLEMDGESLPMASE